MAEYTASDISKLEVIIDGGAAINVNLVDPTAITITQTAVRQALQQGKQATAKKRVEISARLFDQATAVKGALATAEAEISEVAFRVTLLDSDKSIETEATFISIEENVAQADGFHGYTVLGSYEVDRSQDHWTETGFGE